MTSLKKRYEALLGHSLRSLTPVSGGDIGESVRIDLADGTKLFAKRYPGGQSAMSSAEAEGLGWLREAACLRIPKVIAASSDGEPTLILEWIEQRAPADKFDEALGRGLAALHQSGVPGFGLQRDNYIGPLLQRNQPRESWAEFYAHERIAPQVELARRSGRLSVALERRLETLIDEMTEHCGPEPQPARLHGDLWTGNVMADAHGMPCLIDPATYGGHPEMDLAMMKLFGGFSARVFDAYDEASPLAPDFDRRLALWQLYPLLVHLNLFGSNYAAQVDRALGQYA